MKRPARLAGLVALALGAAVVAGLPAARGANTTEVQAAGVSFSPRDLAIQPGDTVVWKNADGGFHNVHFEDASADPATPMPVWDHTISRTFSSAGTYRYVCDQHQPAMSGTVVVGDGGPGPTPTPTVSPTATPPPPPGGGAGVAPPPELRSVALLRDHFCTRRSRTCKKPGVVLAIELSAPAVVRGTLQRAPLRGSARYRRFGGVSFGQVAAGRRRLAFTRTQAGRTLSPGRYRLALEAAGATRTLRFRVRPS